jgi:ribulose-bisphosphate carboxylase large chain
MTPPGRRAARPRPAPSDAVVATYELDGAFPLKDLARVVAMEQTTGTWTPIPKRTGSLEEELQGQVLGLDQRRHVARIAYPLGIFEPTNLPGFFSIVAGNLFGLGSLTRARLVDLEFPPGFARHYPGPAFGVAGVRRLVGTTRTGRPHCGTIVKPKVGLDPRQTAAVCKEAALGGVDFIKDDETLTDQSFCPLDERTRQVMAALDQARDETGHRVLYAVNLTAGAHEVLDRLDRVKAAGANCVMVDFLTSGLDALLLLRRHAKVPIHVHRTMHGALTRSRDFGIGMLAWTRLVRLCGGDQFHVGSASGKMEHPAEMPDLLDALRADWHGLKPTFAVSSGGLHPASVPIEVKAFGADVVLQAGGGIHGHPGGTRAGAKAMRQAIAAVHAGRPIEAEQGPELQAALRRWKADDYRYEA